MIHGLTGNSRVGDHVRQDGCSNGTRKASASGPKHTFWERPACQTPSRRRGRNRPAGFTVRTKITMIRATVSFSPCADE